MSSPISRLADGEDAPNTLLTISSLVNTTLTPEPSHPLPAHTSVAHTAPHACIALPWLHPPLHAQPPQPFALPNLSGARGSTHAASPAHSPPPVARPLPLPHHPPACPARRCRNDPRGSWARTSNPWRLNGLEVQLLLTGVPSQALHSRLPRAPLCHLHAKCITCRHPRVFFNTTPHRNRLDDSSQSVKHSLTC